MNYDTLKCVAGEVGHVVYGARVLQFLGDAVQTDAYWAGTLFPDIRHLGVVSRHKTHPEDAALEMLKGKNDFYTGLRVHAWVDKTREKFWDEQNMKESLPWHPFVPHALKLYEDELLYGKFSEWEDVLQSLKTVRDDELFYVNERQQVQKWHDVLTNYLRTPPGDETRQALSQAIGLSEHSAREVNTVVQRLKHHKATSAIIENFQRYLEDLLK